MYVQYIYIYVSVCVSLSMCAHIFFDRNGSSGMVWNHSVSPCHASCVPWAAFAERSTRKLPIKKKQTIRSCWQPLLFYYCQPSSPRHAKHSDIHKLCEGSLPAAWNSTAHHHNDMQRCYCAWASCCQIPTRTFGELPGWNVIQSKGKFRSL
jgi:hypothetical protein